MYPINKSEKKTMKSTLATVTNMMKEGWYTLQVTTLPPRNLTRS